MSRDRRSRVFRLDDGAKHTERNVDEELAFHLAMRTNRFIAAGLDPAAARAAALRQFGDLSDIRSQCLTIDTDRERTMKRANRFADLRQDMAYALRMLRRNPGYTVVVLLIVALGIGANTAIFTLVDALLLRTLPVPHPEQLITVGDPTRTGGVSQGGPRTDLASYATYVDLRDQNRVTSGLYASGRTNRLDVMLDRGARASGRAATDHPRGRFVSGNYFSVLQVPAAMGRTFAASEDHVPGDDPVVVISDRYWQQHFAGARDAVGRTISINGVPVTIIGVTPRGFTGDIVGQPTDVWIPLMMQPELMPNNGWLTDRATHWLLLMGRLAPGVTLDRARAAFATLERQSLLDHTTAAQYAEADHELRTHPLMVARGDRGFSYYRETYRTALLTLMAAVALVLLVVCANVANLMLARAAARGREMSVRMALGAGRARLVQQLLTESAVIALGGGALGLLVAYWGSAVVLRVAAAGPAAIPLDVHLDGRVLAFTAVLSLVTAFIFGLVPALRATRVSLATALRAQGRGVAGAGSGTGKMSLGRLLVVGQVALSMLLLVGTGMLVRSTRRLEHPDIGLARDRLVIATVDAARSGYHGPRLAALIRDLTDRARRVPGVAAAAVSENGIFSGTESGTTLRVEGFAARADSDTVVAYDDVGPGYFRAIGAHLLRGRDIEPRDNESGSKAVVVNETMARFYFPRGDAIGHHVVIDDSIAWQIVGVVGDIEEQGVRNPSARRLYFSMFQLSEPPGQINLEVRATGDPARLVERVRRAILAADPTLVVRSATLDDLIRDSISQDTLVAQVVTFFGVLALVLAAIGLYGVMAYATVRRTNEFGLRMALGARPGSVARMVLREAMLLVIAGAVIGLPATLLAMRFVKNQLFGVGLLDAPSIAIAIGASPRARPRPPISPPGAPPARRRSTPSGPSSAARAQGHDRHILTINMRTAMMRSTHRPERSWTSPPPMSFKARSTCSSSRR